MTYVLVVSAALGGILLFLLAAATANSPLFAEHYPLLLGLNAVIALALLGLVAYQLAILARQRRARVFGSQLTFRVLLMFAVVGIVPGLLVYTVSLQFLAKSIESWFDVRVERALEGGLGLGRAALDVMLNELLSKAEAMASDLSQVPSSRRPALLARLRERAFVDEASLLNPDGSAGARAGREGESPAAPAPGGQALRAAKERRGFSAVEPVGERGLLLRVIVLVGSPEVAAREPSFLQLTHRVPAALAEQGESVQDVYRAYKELSLSRQGLKEIYILTLTLTLLLALLSAIALAFLLSRRLSNPLAILAEGTQAVARGDFSRRAPVTSRDELGTLTQSFNSMTEQLGEARLAAQLHQAQVETAKAYLESILANLSAGVLVFDRELVLRITNSGAEGILGVDITPLIGKKLQEWHILEGFARTLTAEFHRHGQAAWHQQIEIGERGAVILVRGSPLPETSGGYVAVFDDITQLIAAQRATAWGEVARRLAHEIKNPLTPIQLAAERLQAKLGDRISPEAAEALDRATATIVAQVTAMKNMVDDFRDYARTPPPELSELDLSGLVAEVIALYEQSGTRIEAKLQQGTTRVLGDPDRLRQVIHNLLQNAQDALAGSSDPRIEVSTEQSDAEVSLRISDNGCGFPDAIIKGAFEPYVTTKPKGTGLGLAIVKRIIDEHHGTVRIENRTGKEGGRGAVVRISLPRRA